MRVVLLMIVASEAWLTACGQSAGPLAAAALDDPHVCTVYEAGEHQGRTYIAMAFIDGPTLRDRIAQGPLAIDEASAIARGVAAGLAAAHARGIVHRDIKPGNVMLAGPRLAKITDFGLARMEGASQSTKTAGVAGTPAYMSPEQAQGLQTDQRTDVWSFGCVLCEMLTGRSPFATASGQVDVFAIVHGPAPAVTAFRPDVPASLAAVLDRCLEPDLRRRYQNASSQLEDLEAAGAGSAAPAARAAREAVPSIAVLPFADMSPDRSQEYFGEGIAEEIIHALARIEGVRVVARTSSFAVKGKALDVREIGRVLNVGTVLEGSVRASGSRLRITAQLINIDDGFHIWSERFDREVGDVSDALVTAASMALWYDWDWTAAEAGYRRALAIDPGDAWGRGCYAWFLLNRRRFDECGAAIRQALTTDPLSPLLYGFAVGLHAACRRGDEAMADFRRAVELAPTFGLPYFHAGVALVSQGRFAEAIETVKTGVGQGLTVFWADCILGIAQAKRGAREEASMTLARMIDERQRADVSCASIAWVAACLGDFDTAFAWLDRGHAGRDGLMPWVHVYTDLFVPELARDPRFRPVLERMRLTDVAS